MKVKEIAKLLSAVMAITCISFPAVSHAEDTTETTPEVTATKAVKVNFAPIEYWWDYKLNTQRCYLGTPIKSFPKASNDYKTINTTDGGEKYFGVSMDDNTLTADQLEKSADGIMQNPQKPTFTQEEPVAPDPTDTEKYPNGEEDEAYIAAKAEYDTAKAAYDAAKAEYEASDEYQEKLAVWQSSRTMIEQAAGWSFDGGNIDKYAADGKYFGYDPETFFGGVIDLKEYKDNLYAVYKIKVTEGSLDGAYLGVSYYGTDWYCNKYKSGTSDFNKDESYRYAELWRLGVAGVKLSDYYNDDNEIDADGFHTIIVPLSAFELANADFRKRYSIVDTMKDYTDDCELNYAMLKGIGIAREDTKSGAKFAYETKDYAFVAPQAAQNFAAASVDSGVQLTWDVSTDTDVTYKVSKKVNGNETLITPTESGKYLDTDVDLTDKDTEVSYTIVSQDNTYGVKTYTDEEVFNKAVVTSSVKENLFTVLESAGAETDDLKMFTYGSGYVSQYGDYEGHKTAKIADGAAVITMDDNTIADSDMVKRVAPAYPDYQFNGLTTNPDGTYGVIEKLSGWGYAGFAPKYNEKTDAHQGAVIDARNYMDNGKAVFSVDATNQNLDGVYLTIGYYKNLWDLGFYQDGAYAWNTNFDDTTALAAAKPGWKNGEGNYMSVSFAGVPLKDYYDSTKGGYQTLIVPLSEFANNSTFNKQASKLSSSRLSADDHENTFNPALIKTAGIARMDAHNSVKFEAKINNIEFVAPSGVRKLEGAVNNNNTVTLSWKASTDTDVAKYEVYRNGRKIGETSGPEYTDTDALLSCDYTYAVKTVSTAYDLKSADVETVVTIPVLSTIGFYSAEGDTRIEAQYTIDGTIEADLMSRVSGNRGYAAVFGKDGVLKSVKTVLLGDGEVKTVTLENVSKTDTVRAFIWNADGTPQCDDRFIGEKGDEVLVIGDEFSLQSSDLLDEVAAGAGKSLNVTNAYANGLTMEGLYNNLEADVFTKVVNGSAASGVYTLSEILASGDWKYVIVQDRPQYAEFYDYYIGETHATQLPSIAAAIKAGAPNAALFANEAWGYTADYIANASDEEKAFFDENGYEDFASSLYTSQTSSDYIARALGGTKILTGNAMLAYTPDGSLVMAADGCNLNTAGKFFASAYIYKLMTGASITNAYVPNGVENADAIISAVNSAKNE